MASDREPVLDPEGGDNAYFPSSYSLTQYVAPKTDFDNADYDAYKGKWKVLVVGTEQRYLKMGNGKSFSTGNHPVEMLLPMLHLDAAGFELDVATVSGKSVKLEEWAVPKEDEAIKKIREKYNQKLENPLNLDDVWGSGFDESTPYIAVFIPGGHGAMIDIPFSATLGKILRWVDANKRYYISLCHGPASLLAANVDKPEGSKFIYEGKKIQAFPDSLDTGANIDIGYIPGPMPWLIGDELEKLGVVIVNEKMTGGTEKDGYVLTGDSPLASNKLGHLAAETLLADVAQRA